MDDQSQVARFMNLRDRFRRHASYRETASHAMRYLASASAEMVDTVRCPASCFADEELAVEPTP